MAKSVVEAFNLFQKDVVNLDSNISSKARASRDWLQEQITQFPEKNLKFPILYPEINIGFGSFARKTKTRPLDDIDLMIGLNANGCSYLEYSWDNIEIYFPDHYDGRLKAYASTVAPSCLSSTRITNAFKEELKSIPQYFSADIKRDGEAATLKLKSYDWKFDIVPCFLTQEDNYGKNYYLIPNRNGGWKKTDPRLDRDRLSATNQNHLGNVLNVIRVLKYWNQEKKVGIHSYLLEAMVMSYYRNKIDHSSNFITDELEMIAPYLEESILCTVVDPKNIQGDINEYDWLKRVKLQEAFNKLYELSNEAIQLERNGEVERSISKWREIFGDNFPVYES